MSLISCPECKSQISDQAESCPHCGVPREKQAQPGLRRVALLFAVALWICVGLTVVFGQVRTHPPRDVAVFSSPDGALEVREIRWRKPEPGERGLQGFVRNTTSASYRQVELELDLYDASGEQIGTTLARTENLGAGGTWLFDAPVEQASATDARVRRVEGTR